MEFLKAEQDEINRIKQKKEEEDRLKEINEQNIEEESAQMKTDFFMIKILILMKMLKMKNLYQVMKNKIKVKKILNEKLLHLKI